MKIYEVKLRVREDQLTTLIDVIRGSAEIVALNAIANGAASSQRNNGSTRGVPFGSRPPRTDGLTTRVVVMRVLADGKAHTQDELVAALTAADFAATSISPTISTLRKAKEVFVHSDRSVQLLPK